MLNNLEAVIANMGVLALLAWFVTILMPGFLYPKVFANRPNQIAIGFLFGIGAVLMMMTSIDVGGVIGDGRAAPVLMSWLIGGPWAGVPAALIAAFGRYVVIGGIGALPGLIYVLLVAIAGYALSLKTKSNPNWFPTASEIFVIGVVVSLATMPVILLFPEEHWLTAATRVWPYVSIANIIGLLVLGALVVRQTELANLFLKLQESNAIVEQDKREMANLLLEQKKVIEEKEQLQSVLKHELNKSQHFLRNTSDGMCVVDASGSVVEVSDVFCELLGYERDEIIGCHAAMWDLYFSREEIDQRRKEIFSNDKRVSFETINRRKDGSTFPAEVSAMPMIFDGQNLIFTLSRDISKAQQDRMLLKNAVEQAEEANRLKTEFLANMSHDLRTPLNAIIGFADMMHSQMLGPLPNRYRENAGLIARSGQNLLKSINSILDLSKIESGRFSLEKEPVQLSDLVDDVLRLLVILADERGLHIFNKVQNAKYLNIDKSIMTQVLINLVGNAIKFTDVGFITVESRDDGDSYKITVTDSGIGMSKADIDVALTPFGQVHGNYMSRRDSGTGLGLTISQKLVELHGGKLDIQSELGVGTSVTITLPATLDLGLAENTPVGSQETSKQP
jgi:PAS domain S-box-containing protein